MIRLLVGVLVFVINTVYPRSTYSPILCTGNCGAGALFFLSVLHFYETLGLWRKSDWLKVHFAESWNELHHLLIMEELGGDKMWIDRFLARSVALLYY
jgi:hypothetical protein